MIRDTQVNEHPNAIPELSARVLVELAAGIRKLLNVLDPRCDVLQAIDPLGHSRFVETTGDFIDEIQCQFGNERSQLLTQCRDELSRMAGNEYR